MNNTAELQVLHHLPRLLCPNWLLPVEARDSYAQFACDSIDVATYSLEETSKLPRRTRL